MDAVNRISRRAHLLDRIGPLRRFWQGLERIPPFARMVFSAEGLGSRDGRQLIRGKFRRLTFSVFPAVARHLQKKYKLTGSCISCGTSCNLLSQCPHWDPYSHLCQVYSDRPNICRTFPITPKDIEDRNIMAKRLGKGNCGFTYPGDKTSGLETR